MAYTLGNDEFFISIDSVVFRNDHPHQNDENLFQQPEEETSPELCPHCKLYFLEERKYQNKDVKFCKKDGYLCPIPACYSKLPAKAKSTATAILRCPKGHEL